MKLVDKKVFLQIIAKNLILQLKKVGKQIALVTIEAFLKRSSLMDQVETTWTWQNVYNKIYIFGWTILLNI